MQAQVCGLQHVLVGCLQLLPGIGSINADAAHALLHVQSVTRAPHSLVWYVSMALAVVLKASARPVQRQMGYRIMAHWRCR